MKKQNDEVTEWALSLINKGINVITSKMNYKTWKQEEVPPHISTGQWITGGIGGGSCWDTGEGPDPHYSKDAEPEPEFVQLDKLLEIVWPAITHLQYKNLVRELITIKESSDNDYYGNYTNWSEKKIDIAALYRYLKERNVI